MKTSHIIEIGERLDALRTEDIESAVREADPCLQSSDLAEVAACENFAPSRRAEFLSGRACAREALQALGYQDSKLAADPDGVPQWPAGSVGSITHSRGCCGAVAAQAENYTGLGLDFEQTGRLSDAAAKRVVHPMEAVFASGHAEGATILFSLKEAFYKAQFPKWRVRANFQDIALAVDLEAGIAELALVNESLGALAVNASSRFKFRFAQTEYMVLSLCSVLPDS
mgnify:CR=1 FL=1